MRRIENEKEGRLNRGSTMGIKKVKKEKQK